MKMTDLPKDRPVLSRLPNKSIPSSISAVSFDAFNQNAFLALIFIFSIKNIAAMDRIDKSCGAWMVINNFTTHLFESQKTFFTNRKVIPSPW